MKKTWEKEFDERFVACSNGDLWTTRYDMTQFISSLLQQEKKKWGKTIQKLAERQSLIADEYYKLGQEDERNKKK